MGQLLVGFEAGTVEHAAKAALSGRTALFAGDVAFAIDDYVDGINLGVVHSGQVGIFGEDDGNGARVLGQILLHSLIRFQDIDGENDQVFGLVFLGDVIDELGFFFTVLAPCCPEFKKNHFALDRVVVELLSAGGLGAKAGSGLAGLVALSGIWVFYVDAPYIFHGLTSRALPCVIVSALCGLGSLWLLLRDQPQFSRILAIGAVATVVIGWGVAQYPYMLPESLTINEAAAPNGTLYAILFVFLLAAVLILPSLGLLYYLDQRSELSGEGAET